MAARISLRTRRVLNAVVGLAMLTLSCRDADLASAPSARVGGASGNGGPTVGAVVPESSTPGVTLDITVTGSGFDRGSVVRLERAGVPSPGITTNSTTFVNPKRLTANITIAAAADTGAYDVAVTTSDGRKGVGIELFTVAYQLDELGMFGGTWSRAQAINDLGEVVGASCTQDCLGTAFYWTEAGGLEDLGTLPGFTRSDASAINSRAQVFGLVECRSADPGCGGVYSTRLVRWDRVGGSWTITPVDGCSTVRIAGDQGLRFVINNNDLCVKRTWTGSASTLLVQALSGGAVVSEETLPSVYPGGTHTGYSISDAPMVAGTAWVSGSPQVPVIWYRRSAGSWAFLQLPIPAPDTRGWATDVSESDPAGQVRVSGYTDWPPAGKGQNHAVRWTLAPDGLGGWQVISAEVLPTTSGGPSAGSFAIAVNTGGDAVGISSGYLSGGTPALWPVAGGVEVLPTAGKGGEGRPMDINSSGWIIGSVYDQANACDRAAIWRLR